jgi:transcriptional regulator with XRE-family HTH domain
MSRAASADARRSLGRQVRDLRRARAMTQRELAASSGTPQPEISRIEAGKANATLSTLAALAQALGAALALAELAVGERSRRSAAAPQAPTASPDRSSGSGITRFLCLVCAGTLLEGMSEAEAGRHLRQYRSLTARLRKRGQLLACNRLLPPDTATTVRVRRGKVSVTDGPFAETKEVVGGYFVIEARDRAEAIRIAAALPGAQIGSVEVRPIADDAATLRALGVAAGRSGR